MVNVRTALLLGACLASGLALTTMVIGSRDLIAVEASPDPTTIAPPSTAPPTSAAPAAPDTTPPATTLPPASAPDAAPPPATTASATGGLVVAAAPSATVSTTPRPSVVMPLPESPPPNTPPPNTPPPEPVPATNTESPSPTEAPPAPAVVAPAVTITHPTHSVPGIGSVTVWFDGSSVSVESVSTEADWVSSIDENGPRSIEIKFFNVQTHAEGEVHAEVEDGRVRFESEDGE